MIQGFFGVVRSPQMKLGSKIFKGLTGGGFSGKQEENEGCQEDGQNNGWPRLHP